MLTSFPLFSQLSNIEWQFSRDIEYVDVITSVLETQDGGYLIIGERGDNYEYNLMGFARQYAIKLNSSGQMQWELDLGTPTYDPHINPNYDINAIQAIELKNNGGFIVKRSTGTVLKISSSGVSGATYNTPDQLLDIEYFNDQIVVLLPTKLVTLNTNLVQTAIKDISSIGIAVDMTKDWNNQGVVLGLNNGATGKLACVKLDGTVIWSKTFNSKKVQRVFPFMSKFKSSLIDYASFSVVDSETYSRNINEDDYMVVGKSGTSSWLRVGSFYG